MKLSQEKSQEIVYDNNDAFDTIEDKIIETSRWSELHYIVIQEKATGDFYGTDYSQGLTEFQDEQPFENDNEVEWVQVVPKEKTIIEYVPMEVENL